MLLALPCTVVVLAHRLHRIRSFDQVVVLDGGRVAEQGRPDELLANPQSRLAGLCVVEECGAAARMTVALMNTVLRFFFWNFMRRKNKN